jgi:hypothetical protein
VELDEIAFDFSGNHFLLDAQHQHEVERETDEVSPAIVLGVLSR